LFFTARRNRFLGSAQEAKTFLLKPILQRVWLRADHLRTACIFVVAIPRPADEKEEPLLLAGKRCKWTRLVGVSLGWRFQERARAAIPGSGVSFRRTFFHRRFHPRCASRASSVAITETAPDPNKVILRFKTGDKEVLGTGRNFAKANEGPHFCESSPNGFRKLKCMLHLDRTRPGAEAVRGVLVLGR